MPLIPGTNQPFSQTIDVPAPVGAGGAPEESPVEHLRQAIEHAQKALTAEPDDADSQQLAKVLQGLYQILAQRQKAQDKVMGDPSLLRSLRR